MQFTHALFALLYPISNFKSSEDDSEIRCDLQPSGNRYCTPDFSFCQGPEENFFSHSISSAALHVEVCLTIEGLYNIHQVPRFVKSDYKKTLSGHLVEVNGLEPLTSALQRQRSPN